MVVERDAQSDGCEGCSQAHTCKEAYKRLGCAGGPSVALKAVIAFLLPILVFAGALGLFEGFLGAVVGPAYRTPLAVVIAACITVGVMVIVSTVMRRSR
jgi:hypothetical protein